MAFLPEDAHSAVPGGNMAAMADFPPAAYIPDLEGKAGVALPPAEAVPGSHDYCREPN